jgi:hypothetical protein
MIVVRRDNSGYITILRSLKKFITWYLLVSAWFDDTVGGGGET